MYEEAFIKGFVKRAEGKLSNDDIHKLLSMCLPIAHDVESAPKITMSEATRARLDDAMGKALKVPSILPNE